MNYLAHIYLSGENRQIQLGNFIGDAVKGKAYQQYPPDFQKGILLHRQIDAFSDAHPDVREAIRLGREVMGRYAGVVTDVLWDYFLATGFAGESGTSLKHYCRGFYVYLIWNYRYLPVRFQGFVWHFILTDRLGRYASLEGIRQSLEIMVEYRGVRVDSALVMDFLQEHHDRLRILFWHFFPELKQMCEEKLKELP